MSTIYLRKLVPHLHPPLRRPTEAWRPPRTPWLRSLIPGNEPPWGWTRVWTHMLWQRQPASAPGRAGPTSAVGGVPFPFWHCPSTSGDTTLKKRQTDMLRFPVIVYENVSHDTDVLSFISPFLSSFSFIFFPSIFDFPSSLSTKPFIGPQWWYITIIFLILASGTPQLGWAGVWLSFPNVSHFLTRHMATFHQSHPSILNKYFVHLFIFCCHFP